MKAHYTDAAAVYDVIYKGRVDDFSFYRDLVSELKPKRVLEIGAGTGRILLPCAEANPESHFVAIDGRTDDLAVLHKAAIDKGFNNVEAFDGDFPHPRLSDKFNLIVAPFRVLQHCLTEEAFVSFCVNARNILEDDGQFVFDIFDPNDEMLKKEGLIVAEKVPDEDGNIINRSILVNKRDVEAQLQLIEEHYEVHHADGVQTTFSKEYYTRWHYESEARACIEKAGLNIESVYGTFKKEPVGSTFLGELIFTCSR